MSKILIGRSDVDLDYPVCRPSLDLDFTQEELDPRITFTRGSIGTRVNRNRVIETVAANQPRFDYDPVTGECKGLLIEESRYNDWLYSGQNVTTGWNTNGGTLSIDNTITAPDGTTNTIKFTESSSYTSGKTINQNISVTSGTSYTFSVFVKQPTGSSLRYCSILLYNTGFGEFKIASFNPTNGSILFTSGTLTTSVQQYPNGWWRFAVTGTATATTTTQFSIRFTNNVLSSTGNNGGPYGNYTGDGSSYLYFFGPQVENGAFMTSFIPTSASRVTRSADLASMTETNFSSWYNQNEGTLYANAKSNANTLNNKITGIAALNSGTGTYRVDLRYHQSVNSYTFFNGVNGGGSALSRTSGFSLTNPKFVVSYATQNINFCVNSSLISSRTSAFVPSPLINTLRIGTFDAGTNYYLNGTISRLTYYPRALKPNQLQYLTQ